MFSKKLISFKNFLLACAFLALVFCFLFSLMLNMASSYNSLHKVESNSVMKQNKISSDNLVNQTSNNSNNTSNALQASQTPSNVLSDVTTTPRVTYASAASVTTATPQDSLTKNGANFFRIYNTKTLENNIINMGKITAIKISGLPYSTYIDPNYSTTNELKRVTLGETHLISSTGSQVVYSVPYIRALNPFDGSSLPVTLKDSNNKDVDIKASNQVDTLGLDDAPQAKGTSYGNHLEISKIFGPQSIEVNIFTGDNATNLSDVNLTLLNFHGVDFALDWEKIGSISILNDQGDVYRRDNIALSEFNSNPILIKDEADNIKLSSIKNWVKWSPNIMSSENLSFMWSYSYAKDFTSGANKGHQVFFTPWSSDDRSLTPIISGGKVNIYNCARKTNINDDFGATYDASKPNTFEKTNELLDLETTIEQKAAFLSEINDSGFRGSLSSKMNISSGAIDDANTSVYQSFDLSQSKNDYPQSIYDWKLQLNFSGDASSLDRESLSNLVFLGEMKNIIDFSISTDIPPNSYSLDFFIDDLSFMKNWNRFANFAFTHDNNTNISVWLFNANNAEWIANTVNNGIVNLTSLTLRKNGNALITDLAATSWIYGIHSGVKLYLPVNPLVVGTFAGSALVKDFSFKFDDSVDYTDPKTSSWNNFKSTVLTKTSAPGLRNPNVLHDSKNVNKPIEKSFFLDSAGSQSVNALDFILVDEKPVFAKPYDGEFFWDFGNIDISKIVYIGSNFLSSNFQANYEHYYTESYVNDPNNKISPNNINRISASNNAGFAHPNIRPVIVQNRGNLVTKSSAGADIETQFKISDPNTSILVNETEIDEIVYNSSILYPIKLDDLKYCFLDSKNKAHYFTNADEVNKILLPNQSWQDLKVNIVEGQRYSNSQNQSTAVDYNLFVSEYSTIAKSYTSTNQDLLSFPNADIGVDKQVIYIDDQKVDQRFLLNGISFWAFPEDNSIKPENIRFRSLAGNKDHFYTSPFGINNSLRIPLGSLVSIKQPPSTSIKQSSLPVVIDGQFLDDASVANSKIRIDGVEKGSYILNNKLFWDYDINQILFVRNYSTQVNGVSVMAKEYFTNFADCKKVISNNRVNQASLVQFSSTQKLDARADKLPMLKISNLVDNAVMSRTPEMSVVWVEGPQVDPSLDASFKNLSLYKQQQLTEEYNVVTNILNEINKLNIKSDIKTGYDSTNIDWTKPAQNLVPIRFLPILKNGSWYRGVPAEIMSFIKYKDSQGNLYTFLSDNNFTKVGISSVQLNIVDEPENTTENLPRQITENDIPLLNKTFTFSDSFKLDKNGAPAIENYNYVLVDGKIYWPPELLENARFFVKSTLGNTKFYRTFEELSASDKTIAWSSPSLNDKNKNIDLPTIKAPDKRGNNVFQPLFVYNGWKLIKVNVVKLLYEDGSEMYYYDDLDLLKSVKYVDSFGNYYTGVDASNYNKGLTTVDIKNSHLEKVALQTSMSKTQVLIRNSDAGMYIAIGIGCMIVFGTSTIFAAKYLLQGKKK